MYIYKLTCDASEDVYIGSTITPLVRRLAKHKNYFKRHCDGKRKTYVSSFKLFEQGEVAIELVEETDDIKREGWHIQNTPNCVNERIAGRSKKQILCQSQR